MSMWRLKPMKKNKMTKYTKFNTRLVLFWKLLQKSADSKFNAYL